MVAGVWADMGLMVPDRHLSALTVRTSQSRQDVEHDASTLRDIGHVFYSFRDRRSPHRAAPRTRPGTAPPPRSGASRRRAPTAPCATPSSLKQDGTGWEATCRFRQRIPLGTEDGTNRFADRFGLRSAPSRS